MFSWLELGIGCNSILHMAVLTFAAGLLDVGVVDLGPMAFLRIVLAVRHLRTRQRWPATLWVRRSMRSTMISRCNSPMPEISVSPGIGFGGNAESRIFLR